MRKAGQQGFTLIELSIVLVIIGLIVGGILVGRDLITAAESKRIVNDVQRFKTATYAFRDKYNCLPGDCANATTFFGVSSTGCQTPATNSGHVTATGGKGTCNGEGHNIIGTLNLQGDEDLSYGGGRTAEDPFQKVLFFHHLGLAGMIPGTYTGTFSTSTSSPTGFVAGVDVPLTGRNAAIFPNYEVPAPSSGTQWSLCASASPGITLWYAMAEPGADYFTVGLPAGGVCPFLTPAEAASLDTKYDDGKAWSGAIVAPDYYGHNSKCTNDTTGGTWQLSDTTPSCHLMFMFFQ